MDQWRSVDLFSGGHRGGGGGLLFRGGKSFPLVHIKHDFVRAPGSCEGGTYLQPLPRIAMPLEWIHLQDWSRVPAAGHSNIFYHGCHVLHERCLTYCALDMVDPPPPTPLSLDGYLKLRQFQASSKDSFVQTGQKCHLILNQVTI